jgi:hypothetical protein
MTTSKENTIELIFDPHGNGLNAEQNYEHQKVNITLGKARKTLMVHLST